MESLPKDILGVIIAQLDLESLICLHQVSKRFKKLTSLDDIYKKFLPDEFPVLLKLLEKRKELLWLNK